MLYHQCGGIIKGGDLENREHAAGKPRIFNLVNVLFHTLAGGAIAVLLAPPANTKRLSKGLRCASAFVLSVLSHGLLDWAPHCYPIASKVDVIVSLAIMIFAFFRSAKAFRPILIAAFVGAILPDVLDLSPAILAKQTGWNVPVFPHFFP